MPSKEPTAEEITHNQSLWHWYPLGQMDAIWNMVEHLAEQIDHKRSAQLSAVFDALQELDDGIRADRYPMPKKRVPARPHLENGGRRELKNGRSNKR